MYDGVMENTKLNQASKQTKRLSLEMQGCIKLNLFSQDSYAMLLPFSFDLPDAPEQELCEECSLDLTLL